MFDKGAESVANTGSVERVRIERGDEDAVDCEEGAEGRRVGVCMREKGREDREEGGRLGSEESRRDEWNEYRNEV